MVDETAQHLASNLKRMREARGWSQQHLADISSVPRPTIANLESGECNPTLSVMLKVATALGTSIEKLIAGAVSRFEVFRSEELDKRLHGGAMLNQLYGDACGNLIERLELPQKSTSKLSAVREGLQQIVSCERGRVELRAGVDVARLRTGDVLRWHGIGGIAVENPGSAAATLLLVTMPVPIGE